MTLPPAVSGAKPLLGHALEFLRNPEGLIERGYREQGTMFTVQLPGNPAVVLLGPERAKFMFAQPDSRLSIREAYAFLRHMFEKAFWIDEHDQYLRQREILLPLFTGKHVAGHLGLMESKTAAFIDALPAEGEFDLVNAFGPLIMDISANAFLGAEVATRIDGLFEVFRDFAGGMDPLIPGWFPAPHLIRSRRARDLLRAKCRELIDERRRNPLPEPDFLQTLATAVYADTNEPVPDSVLTTLLLVLMWVGHETTTGHLSWAVIDLLQHPLELKKVRVEVENVETLDRPTLHRLQHLDHALHESERLHPITNGVVRRAMEPFDYDGHHFPKGTMVILHQGMSHRLSEVFAGPDEFNPDRFQTEPKTKQALFGFGGGLHKCLGEHFTYLELKVVVTRLLQRLDMELVDTDPRPEKGQKNKWPQSPCRVSYKKKR